MNTISDAILSRVEKPARYIGGEFNSVVKNKNDVNIRFAFCFPDVYEVGMSHLGSKILYHTLNERKDTYCERCYAPWPDMEKELKDNNIPLFTLESKDSLCQFDILGFTLQYEMSYTNILNMLSMGNIKIKSEDRTEKDPIIFFGGPCAYNPEPLYKIADFFALGEGEEELNDVLDLFKTYKNGNNNKQWFLREASKIPGIYVPSLYTVDYNEDNTIKEFKPIFDDVPKIVKKRIITNFNDVAFPDKLLVPYTEIIHDRVTLETFRGCTRGCRFCQAGMIYRPVREKSTETLLKQAEQLIKATGYDEVSLISLSICDYSNIHELIRKFIEIYGDKKIGVSLPSIRIDSLFVDILNEIQKVRKSGLTLAPEAGTQRMRDIINKGVTEEDLINSAYTAFSQGWATIKLYFMLGLPYETKKDVLSIADLGNKVVEQYFKVPKSVRRKGLRVTISSAIFVPKPFTPFQWVAQDKMSVIKGKIGDLKRNIKSKAISYNWHESPVSFMEAVFARGDRRICDVLIRAYEKGARFDGWHEHFDYEIWKEAFTECNVDPEFYAYRERSYDEILPWDFIDVGVTKEFLIRENEKAKRGEVTPDCREQCADCGINKSFKEGKCFEGAISNKIC